MSHLLSSAARFPFCSTCGRMIRVNTCPTILDLYVFCINLFLCVFILPLTTECCSTLLQSVDSRNLFKKKPENGLENFFIPKRMENQQKNTSNKMFYKEWTRVSYLTTNRGIRMSRRWWFKRRGKVSCLNEPRGKQRNSYRERNNPGNCFGIRSKRVGGKVRV